MAKPITFLFIVLGIWFYMEIQTEGLQGAFGGKLAWIFAPVASVRTESEPPPGPITDRVRERVTGVMEKYEQDRLRMGAER